MTGENLRKIRLRMKIKQADIAKETGLDKAIISRIESGKSDKTLQRWCRILQAYGIEIVPKTDGMTLERAIDELNEWNDFEETE